MAAATKLTPFICLLWSDPRFGSQNLGVISQEVSISDRDEWSEARSNIEDMIGHWCLEKALLIDPLALTVADVTKALVEQVAAGIDPYQCRDQASEYEESVCRMCEDHDVPPPLDSYSAEAHREMAADHAAHLMMEA